MRRCRYLVVGAFIHHLTLWFLAQILDTGPTLVSRQICYQETTGLRVNLNYDILYPIGLCPTLEDLILPCQATRPCVLSDSLYIYSLREVTAALSFFHDYVYQGGESSVQRPASDKFEQSRWKLISHA
ncbi:hypothetical protein BJ170DRAFT_488076 [Xylariales sp. AK1849]|nr:hypothetical protein BJ170DRAFT_488076 [Xylariales sp. AK1849]